jgi:general secretion pathway protein G
MKSFVISEGGFSYIEIIISLAIMAIIASAASPYVHTLHQREKETELRRTLRDIRNAIDSYKKATDTGRIQKNIGDSGFPKVLNDLVRGIPDAKDPSTHKIYFLRKIPVDPMFPGLIDNPELSWGKRSYDSNYDDPREGNDVFDIYSLSQEKGLNGVPYKMW